MDQDSFQSVTWGSSNLKSCPLDLSYLPDADGYDFGSTQGHISFVYLDDNIIYWTSWEEYFLDI